MYDSLVFVFEVKGFRLMTTLTTQSSSLFFESTTNTYANSFKLLLLPAGCFEHCHTRLFIKCTMRPMRIVM